MVKCRNGADASDIAVARKGNDSEVSSYENYRMTCRYTSI